MVKIIKIFRNDSRTFRVAKKYLGRGIYFVSIKNGSIAKTTKIHRFRDCIHLRLKVANKKVNNNKIQLKEGCGKIIVILDNIVFAIYKSKKLYYRAKSNYNNYSEKLTFDYAKVLSFDDNHLTTKIEKIDGVHFFDKRHDELVLKYIIDYTLKAPKMNIDNQYYYLQHGDLKNDNMIWFCDNSFILIDLDNIGYRVLFYDLVHYVANISADINDVIRMIYKITTECYSQNKSEIINQLKNLDVVFSNYVYYYIKMGCCFDDLVFLEKLDSSQYPLTLEAINKIVDAEKQDV